MMVKFNSCFNCGSKIGFWTQRIDLKDGAICGKCESKYALFEDANQAKFTKYLEDLTVSQCQELLQNPEKLKRAKKEYGYKKPIFGSNDSKQKKKIKKCSICGNEIGRFDQCLDFKDGLICSNEIKKYKFSKNNNSDLATFKAISWAQDHTIADFKNMVASNLTFIDIQEQLEQAKTETKAKKIKAKEQVKGQREKEKQEIKDAKAKKCALCGKKLGILDYKIKLKDGFICKEDIIKYDFSKPDSGIPTSNAKQWLKTHSTTDLINLVKQDNSFKKVSAKMDAEERKRKAEQQAKFEAQRLEAEKKKESYQRTLKEFKEHSLKISHYYIRKDTQQILIAKTFLDDPKIVNFSDIISYEVNERGHNEHKHHGITRAVVGGTLAGGVGAIIGATTGGSDKEYTDHLGLIINLKDGSNFEIPFLRIKDKTNSSNVRYAYGDMQNVISMIEAGMHSSNEKSSNSSKSENDIPSQIRKYKELADDGIITKEEFEAKKKQLLGL